MVSISLCMIARNEEEVLGRCLESIAGLTDEIVLVDTGSTDRTREMAREYGARVFDLEWAEDFAAARNFSFSKAECDYILWLDADDVLLEHDRKKMGELKRSLDRGVDVVMMRYNVGFDNEGNVTLSYYRERLLKRASGFQWIEPVHEYIQPSGCIIESDICITHRKMRQSAPGRNLRIYEKRIAARENLTPRSLFYYGTELYYAGKPAEASEVLLRFIDSGEGWIEDRIRASWFLADCHFGMGEPEKGLRALFRSFEFDTPRAEICCRAAEYYKSVGSYEKAVFWYELATRLQPPGNCWGFLLHDYWGYIPALELCVCHYRLGHYEESVRWNDRAAELKPDSPAVKYNKRLFGFERGGLGRQNGFIKIDQ